MSKKSSSSTEKKKKEERKQQQQQHTTNNKQKQDTVTNTEIFTELKILNERVRNLEEGIFQVNTNVISTKQCVLEEAQENRQQVGKLKKQIKKLEKNWETSPYRIIIICSGSILGLLLFVKYVF